MNSFEIKYDPSEWHIFIDLPIKSLTVALLPNGNAFASTPMRHSMHLKVRFSYHFRKSQLS